MESNKNEALRCVRIARDALRSGDNHRAARFLRLARRLHPEVAVDHLLADCDPPRVADPAPGHAEESVRLVGEIRRRRDYYEVLGLERGCSGEEIRKAYRRLSLKVHPDKNRAPGSDEAFRIVSEAFKCLSDEGSRRRYDACGSATGLESNPWSKDMRYRSTSGRRRGRESDESSYEELDPDEVFRSFFFGSGGNVYRARHEYRPRPAAMPAREPRVPDAPQESGFGSLLHLVPFLAMILILCLPFSEPDYALQRNYTFRFPKTVEGHGVEYYVKSLGFDSEFPPGSTARANLEYKVLRDYRGLLGRYCRVEMQRRQWVKDYPVPHCDRLRELEVAQDP